MIVVLSGEGPTDLGQCGNSQSICEDGDFQIGPMTVLLDKMIESYLKYSLQTTPGAYLYVNKVTLAEYAKSLKRGRNVSLVGRKLGKETTYYFKSAWLLASVAKEMEAKRQDTSIAVLFRDCDGTCSAEAGLWEAKWESMINGFDRADYSRGVPMIPKPKSEAWMLCQSRQSLSDCACLEEISGNDDSPNPAKEQLDEEFGKHMSRGDLCDWLTQIHLDMDKLSSMKSFKAFKNRLEEVISEVAHLPI